MVYKRAGGTLFTFQARTRHGWQPLTAPTSSKTLAAKIEHMWSVLATDHRAWDLLEPVLVATRGERRKKLGRLYDDWVATEQRPVEMRRRLSDVNVAALLPGYLTVHGQQTGAGWHRNTTYYLKWLLPEGTPRQLSEVTVEWLTERLYAYPAGRTTLQRVHSAWSGFFGYCAKVRGLFLKNPMLDVTRPPARTVPVRFYELDQVTRIVNAQPTQERRALFALLYGTGIEVGTAIRLTRADVWEASREIRAAGTKTHTRDRVAVVADWAWPIIVEYVRSLLPAAPLFPTTRHPYQVSHWQRWLVVEVLKITPRLKVHAARHHWAVSRLRAGVPIALVQRQLGHSTPMLTLNTYGAFIPTGEDRAHWESQTTAAEARRTGAK